jgi:hypothetical protein
MNRSLTVGQRIGGKAELLIRRYGTEGVSLAAIAVTAAGSIPRVFGGPILWILGGLVLGGVAVLLRERKRESLESIREARDTAVALASSSAAALRDAVKPLANNLHEYLGLSESHQRLSIYLHHHDRFLLVSRVAQDPSFRFIGRKSYPESQGVIGTVWREGDAHERIGRAEAWSDWAARFGFTPDEAESLKMKSQCIAAVRLDHDHQSVGIVLIESERPRGISAGQFEQLRESYITRSLAELLTVAGPRIVGGLDTTATSVGAESPALSGTD